MTIREFKTNEELWDWLLAFPPTVVVDGEPFVSAEELYAAFCEGLFEDIVHFHPGESCGSDDEVEYFRHVPEDYRAVSGEVWSWGQFWGHHLDSLSRLPEDPDDESYADMYAAYLVKAQA